MILQNRDIDILKFIAKFGYVNSLHISNMFNLSKPRTSQIVQRLIKANYIKKDNILVNEPSVFSLLSAGAELLKTNRVKKITLQNLKHNILCVDVYIDLIKQNPELEILSDREQRAGKFGKTANRSLPDLLIKTEEQNGKKDIAIEIELSKKNKQRIKKVIAKRSREYLETQYYCNASTYGYISKEIKLMSNIKAFSYFEYEEIPEEITEILESIKKPESANDVTTENNEQKILKIKINKLEAEKKDLLSRLDILETKKRKLISTFENIQFKKATFGNSYSVSGEDLELLSRYIK